MPWRREGLPTPAFCLKNSMTRGAWWATVHGVAWNWTWLSDSQFSLSTFSSPESVCRGQSVLSLGSVRKGRRKGLLVAGRAGGVWEVGAQGGSQWGPWSWQHVFLSVTWTRCHLRPSWAFSHRSVIIASGPFLTSTSIQKWENQGPETFRTRQWEPRGWGWAGSGLDAGQVVWQWWLTLPANPTGHGVPRCCTNSRWD